MTQPERYLLISFLVLAFAWIVGASTYSLAMAKQEGDASAESLYGNCTSAARSRGLFWSPEWTAKELERCAKELERNRSLLFWHKLHRREGFILNPVAVGAIIFFAVFDRAMRHGARA